MTASSVTNYGNQFKNLNAQNALGSVNAVLNYGNTLTSDSVYLNASSLLNTSLIK